jgi:hypothetical protein
MYEDIISGEAEERQKARDAIDAHLLGGTVVRERALNE